MTNTKCATKPVDESLTVYGYVEQINDVYSIAVFVNEECYEKMYQHLKNGTYEWTIYTDALDELPEPQSINWRMHRPISFAIDTEENRIVGCIAHQLTKYNWQ